jgi:hypothetical protein
LSRKLDIGYWIFFNKSKHSNDSCDSKEYAVQYSNNEIEVTDKSAATSKLKSSELKDASFIHNDFLSFV